MRLLGLPINILEVMIRWPHRESIPAKAMRSAKSAAPGEAKRSAKSAAAAPGKRSAKLAAAAPTAPVKSKRSAKLAAAAPATRSANSAAPGRRREAGGAAPRLADQHARGHDQVAAPWVDAHAPVPGAYDKVFLVARTGAILEFELLDIDCADGACDDAQCWYTPAKCDGGYSCAGGKELKTTASSIDCADGACDDAHFVYDG